MAWGFISELPVGRDEYDRLNGEIGDDPPGLILHTASEKDGKMRIVDVWESKDAYERFEQATLMPAMGRIGADAPAGGPPPRRGEWRPAARPPARQRTGRAGASSRRPRVKRPSATISQWSASRTPAGARTS